MTIAEIIMIIAILTGPVLAIQIAQFLDRRKDKKNRKLKIFKTLMSTRMYRTHFDHVLALNTIELEFDLKEDNDVIVAWKSYIDSLRTKFDGKVVEQHVLDKQYEHFVELLLKMAIVLGYGFDKTQIKNLSYAPIAHSNIDWENQLIRTGLIEMLHKEKPLAMILTNFNKANSPREVIS